MNSRREWEQRENNPGNSNFFKEGEFGLIYSSSNGEIKEFIGELEKADKYILRKLHYYTGYLLHEHDKANNVLYKKSSKEERDCDE